MFFSLFKLKLSSSQIFLLGAVLYIVLAFSAYKPVLKAGFIWDDDDYATHVVTRGGIDGLRSIWLQPGATPQYYPLVYTSFWIENFFWSQRPAGYHAVNIFLHAIVSILLMVLLLDLGVKGAFFAGILFLLHPVHVESVAWISERKNTLSALFFLLALYSYGRFSGWSEPISTRKRSRYWTSYLFFLFALFSKTVTCLMPIAVLLLFLLCSLKRNWRHEVLYLVPFLITGFVFSRITLLMELNIVGSENLSWTYSLFQKCEIAGRALWFYCSKLLWPNPLIFNYPKWVISSSLIKNMLPITVFLIFIVVLFFRQWSWGRGPLVAFLWFFLFLFPALGFFPVYPFRFSFVADHFQYLASMGPVALFASLASSLVNKTRLKILQPSLLCLLGFMVFRQSLIYRNPESLWLDTLKKNPESWLAMANMGVISLEKSDYKSAEAYFSDSLKRHPYNFQALTGVGASLAYQGRDADALNYYERALRIEPRYQLADFLYKKSLQNINGKTRSK